MILWSIVAVVLAFAGASSLLLWLDKRAMKACVDKQMRSNQKKTYSGRPGIVYTAPYAADLIIGGGYGGGPRPPGEGGGGPGGGGSSLGSGGGAGRPDEPDDHHDHR